MREYKLRLKEDVEEDDLYIFSLQKLNEQMSQRIIEDKNNLRKMADLKELENKNLQMMIATNKIDLFINQIEKIN